MLHRRPGVRAETIAQVERAIRDLDRQRSQVHLSTKAVIFDLVMQAPTRFSEACRAALEAELTGLRPALARARFSLDEQPDPAAAARILGRIRERGSNGVILKAPDHPAVATAIGDLHAAGIPTVTLVTDVTGSARVGYVGLDNLAAGATAAFLIANWAGATGDVLLTLSHSWFSGEELRERGFRDALADLAPERRVHRVSDAGGLDDSMVDLVGAAIERHPAIDSVYSIGGGNRATLTAFRRAPAGARPKVFVAHDLDADNVELLRTRQLTAVLHHDLHADLRRASRLLLQAAGILPGPAVTIPSQVQVVTPFNEPSRLRPR